MDTVKKNWLRYIVHIGALLPLAQIGVNYMRGAFIIDPVREITTQTGRVALTLLILSLACTPINIVFGWKRVLRVRRALGLYAFLYAALHFLTFAGWDYGFDLRLLWTAIFYQRFVIVGFFAFVLLLILAITSTRAWQKRLGKRWKSLHRAAYLAAMLVIVHFLWLVKDPRRPLRYGVILGVLLVLRLPPIQRGFKKARAWVKK